MVKSMRRRLISLVVSLVLVITAIPAMAPVHEAAAASKYIKVDAFIEYLVTELQLPVDMNSKQPYIDAAMKAGILKNDDFKDYTVYLTRTDCAVLANRADEYIYGSHYGFTDEVYEFLSGCEYFEGMLYYNIKGSLYPEGVDFNYFSADQFLKDVVMPRLDPSFKFPKGLAAQKWADMGLTGDVVYGEYIRIGQASSGGWPEAFNEDDYLVQAWKRIIDGDRKVKAVYDLRISDLNKIEEGKKQDVAEIVAKGIIKGYSNGKYIQNRAFKGSGKITAAGAKAVVSLVLDQYSRALISPDGQLIRTKNLPKNYYEYPYILECFPNDFYEMNYYFSTISTYMNGTMLKDDYKIPVDAGNKELVERYSRNVTLGMKPYEFYDSIISHANNYLKCVLNVDYRTMDKKWVEQLAASYAPFNGFDVYEEVKPYIQAVKKNHVVVESQIISVEPSSMYRYLNNYYVRVYAKYRITADTVNVEDDMELIFSGLNTYLVGIKNGEWTYGYYDILMVGTGESGKVERNFGAHPWAGINDWRFKGAK